MHDCAEALSTPAFSCHPNFRAARSPENLSLLQRLGLVRIVATLFIAMTCFLLPARLSAQYTDSTIYSFCVQT